MCRTYIFTSWEGDTWGGLQGKREGKCLNSDFPVFCGRKCEIRISKYEINLKYKYNVKRIIMSKESNPFVRLAEEAVKKYIIEHKIMRPPEDLPSEMKERGGVFVSLKKNKRLRGCIGTFIPTRDSIAEEIIQNAISSATKDPRFPPVTIKEIEELEYSVDLLSPPEPVSDVKDLDPKRYGVIVKNGDKRGLLLPDLDGVDTVSKQIEIAKQKADISKDEEIELFRFEVKRYR